jgi:glutathione peroxidase
MSSNKIVKNSRFKTNFVQIKNAIKMAYQISDIQINDIFGQPFDWEIISGKKLMIVNVASECGYTNQYVHLEELYQKYKDKLLILGCPCNDFGGQEPGSQAEIVSFCQKNYGVTFPLSEKITITSEPHPLYLWLTAKEQNGVADFEVKWNFHKFLINADGTLFTSLSSSIEPMSDEILDWLDSN